MPTRFHPALLQCDWLSSCPTGIAAVDADHRRLLSLLHELHEAVIHRRDEDCRRVIAMFTAELTAHFRREESLLSRGGATHATAHAVDHDRLETQMREIARAASQETNAAGLAGPVDSLAALLMSEIVGLDSQFRGPKRDHPSTDDP